MDCIRQTSPWKIPVGFDSVFSFLGGNGVFGYVVPLNSFRSLVSSNSCVTHSFALVFVSFAI